MKNILKFTIYIATLSTWLIISGASSCVPVKTSVPNPATSKITQVQVDSIINTAVTTKLNKINTTDAVKAKQQGYLLSSNINSAPYLVGSLYDMETATDGTVTFSSIMDFNYLNSPKNLTSALLSTDPDFDSYVNKGFSTDVSSIVAKGGLSDDESAHVRYETIFSAVGIGNYLDRDKIDADSKAYDFRTLKHPVIISQVVVKRLSYTKYKKVAGSIAVTSSVVNVNGSMYYQTGTEANDFEMYIFKTDLRLKANGVADTTKATLLRMTNEILNKTNKMGRVKQLVPKG